MKKRKWRSTKRNCKSKKWRRKRRRNTKRGKSTNKLRCTINPAKPCVLASSSLHPLHPQLPPIFTTPTCLCLSPPYQFYHHWITKAPTYCLPPILLLPEVSLPLLTTTLCHLPIRRLPQPNSSCSAPILAWRGWSSPRTSTLRTSPMEGPWWPMPTRPSSPLSPWPRGRDLPRSL